MDATPEEWRPVIDWEDLYEVSDQGRVRSLDRVTEFKDGRTRSFWGKVLMPYRSPAKKAYFRVALTRSGKMGYVGVHSLVLEAFVGPRPEGMQACHWNDDEFDNRLVNLRWDTPSANMYDCVRNGHDVNSKKTHCRRGNHELTPENTKITSKGGRQCRTCFREGARRRYWAAKAKAKAMNNQKAEA